MSAFLVENQTINGVVAYFGALKMKDSAIHRTLYAEGGIDTQTREGRAALGAAMFELNCAALDARYGEGTAANDSADCPYAWTSTAPPTPVQAFKSLQCWLYQCSEGDIPDTSLLYATMTRVKDQLAISIVEAMPQYEKAKW